MFYNFSTYITSSTYKVNDSLLIATFMKSSILTDHPLYSITGSGLSENESGDDKLSHHSSSPESGICNSCDRQSLISGQIPASIDVDALAWGNVTHTGGRLTVADSGKSNIS